MKKNKNIILFLLSQVVSIFGSSIVQYAIIWYITLETQSGVMMTIATVCAFLPQILISIFSGVWADKYNKKMIIAVSDTCIALSTLMVAICFLMGMNQIWLLFVALAIRSFGSGVQTPTVNSFIPELVDEDKLMRVNGINTTIQSITLIVSPAVSGALMPIMPIGSILFIDVVTALIGVGILMFVKMKKKESTGEEKEKVNYLENIKEGLVYIKNHTFIKRFLMYFAFISILIAPLSLLTPLMLTRNFGAEEWRLTVNEIIFFVGSIIGGGVISVWGGFKNKIHTLALACFLCGIFGVMIGLSSHFVMFIIAMGLVGLSMPFFNTPAIVILQETVDNKMYGRVFAVVNMIGSGIMPLSMVVFGPLADVIKIEYILVATSILFALVPILILRDKKLRLDKVKKVEVKEELEEGV